MSTEPEDWTEEEKITGKCTTYVPPLVPEPPGIFRPYEVEYADGLTNEAKNCFVIIHAGHSHHDYDEAFYGEMLEWRGVGWERNVEKWDSVWRLHDPENPERIIWWDSNCLTTVPDHELLNACLDPCAWLSAWPI